PLLSTRYAGRNPYTVYLVDLFVTPPVKKLECGGAVKYPNNSSGLFNVTFLILKTLAVKPESISSKRSPAAKPPIARSH
ncbi:hypothetical protein QUA30_08965, partial [Microcoleus sp. Pol14C2]|uniref:hypothetical protein n=1 Tax=unclassified Microcoleus TaxID=2642155 RepID=UPI002FCFFD50